MVLHHVGVKEQVKPVGVAEFGFAQVSVFGFGGVCQFKVSLTGDGVHDVVVEHVVHAAIHTCAATTCQGSKFKPTFLFHFFIDTHLLLRVTDVVVAVTGFQAVGEFTRIINRCVSGATGFGGHHNHTRHSLCTINGCCTTVFQDLETFNIVGIQTGNG